MHFPKKAIFRKGLALFVAAYIAIVNPTMVWAANEPVAQEAVIVSELDRLEFLSGIDYKYTDSRSIQLVTGQKTNISLRLFDEDDVLFTGNVYCYIAGEDQTVYSPITGSQGNYTIQNVVLDEPGEYSLVIWDDEGDIASGTIDVLGSVSKVSGNLSLNTNSVMAVQLTDTEGNPLGRQTVAIDGTEVGAGVSNYITLYDGTFSFRLTPTTYGEVKIILGGHVVGTVGVEQGYTHKERIGGDAQDNASLSVEVALKGWTSAHYVILTRDDDFADAMTSVPLAKKYDAPILMTSQTQLASSILNEIIALQAGTVLIVGGEGAISGQIEQQLQDSGLKTERIAGSDRYETAVRIAEKLGTSDTLYLSYGMGEADALAVSPFAARQGNPILLTEQSQISDITQQKISELAPKKIVILGGTGVVSTKIENQLRAEYNVERWGGRDRYETEQIILDNLLMKESPAYFTNALVAKADVQNASPFGDALLAAALAAKHDGFIVTLPPYIDSHSSFSLSSQPYSFMLQNRQYFKQGTVVGNSKAVSPVLEEAIERLLLH